MTREDNNYINFKIGKILIWNLIIVLVTVAAWIGFLLMDDNGFFAKMLALLVCVGLSFYAVVGVHVVRDIVSGDFKRDVVRKWRDKEGKFDMIHHGWQSDDEVPTLHPPHCSFTIEFKDGETEEELKERLKQAFLEKLQEPLEIMRGMIGKESHSEITCEKEEDGTNCYNEYIPETHESRKRKVKYSTLRLDMDLDGSAKKVIEFFSDTEDYFIQRAIASQLMATFMPIVDVKRLNDEMTFDDVIDYYRNEVIKQKGEAVWERIEEKLKDVAVDMGCKAFMTVEITPEIKRIRCEIFYCAHSTWLFQGEPTNMIFPFSNWLRSKLRNIALAQEAQG